MSTKQIEIRHETTRVTATHTLIKIIDDDPNDTTWDCSSFKYTSPVSPNTLLLPHSLDDDIESSARRKDLQHRLFWWPTVSLRNVRQRSRFTGEDA